jgi:hypothetical protein
MAKFNSNYQIPAPPDLSGIVQAGAAWGDAYESVGKSIADGIKAWGEKKDENEAIDNLVEQDDILDQIYDGRERPSDPKEVRKDVKSLYKELGGTKGVQGYMREVKADERAARAEERAANADQRAEQTQKFAEFQYNESVADRDAQQSTYMKALTPNKATGNRPADATSREGFIEQMGDLNERESMYAFQMMEGLKLPDKVTLGASHSAAMSEKAYLKGPTGNKQAVMDGARIAKDGGHKNPGAFAKKFAAASTYHDPKEVGKVLDENIENIPGFDDIKGQQKNLRDIKALLEPIQGEMNTNSIQEVAALTTMVKLFEKGVLTDKDIGRYSDAEQAIYARMEKAIAQARRDGDKIDEDFIRTLSNEDKKAIWGVGSALRNSSNETLQLYEDSAIGATLARFPGLNQEDIEDLSTYSKLFSEASREFTDQVPLTYGTERKTTRKPGSTFTVNGVEYEKE